MDCNGGLFSFLPACPVLFRVRILSIYIYEKIRMIRCRRILKKDLIHPSLPTIMYTV